jgi:hypothetical protein
MDDNRANKDKTMKRNETYLPLLEEFGSITKFDSPKAILSGPFLPHAKGRYEISKPKYFYCGQDTYWWVDFAKFASAYEGNRLSDYLAENDTWLSVENIKKHSNNNQSSFWTLVIRLHLFLRTQRRFDLSEITPAEDQILEEIGWGNINSIEVPKTLENEGRWETLDKDTYWKIKEASRGMDAIKHIIHAFNPDIIFIFNWDSAKEADAFRDLNAKEDLSKSVAGLLAIYSIAGYNTKVVWCPHPNNLRYKSQNIDGLIDIIHAALA